MNLAIAAMIIIILILVILVARVILPISTIIFTFPPSIPTEKRLINDIVDEIAKSEVKGKKFYDLGSGTGSVCFSLAKNFPSLKIIGIEKFRFIFQVSKMKQYYLKYKNVSLSNEDLFQTDLSKADYIFTFLTKSFLDKLQIKIKQEAKPGCLIFSNNFPFDALPLYKKITYPDLFTKRYLYIYKI